MGFSDSKLLRRIDPTQWFIRKHGLNWGNVVTRNWRKLMNGSNPSSASGYATINGAYGVANDYKLDTRYRSLAELTGTK